MANKKDNNASKSKTKQKKSSNKTIDMEMANADALKNKTKQVTRKRGRPRKIEFEIETYDQDYDDFLKLTKKIKEEDLTNKKTNKKTKQKKNVLNGKNAIKPENQINSDLNIEENVDDFSNNIDNENTETPIYKKSNSGISNGFFYSGENMLMNFDDNELLKYIQLHYPLYNLETSDDTTLRKTIVQMFNNVKFMNDLLKIYEININDFIKFLYRMSSGLFKGTFISRIKRTLKYKRYAVAARKLSYSEKRKARLKAARSIKGK